jgi:hypothetical protein
MRVTIANISQIPKNDFRAALQALRRQCNEDFQPEWNMPCVLRSATPNIKGTAPIEGIHDAIIYVGDQSEDPNTGIDQALGYHSATHKGVPYGFIYLDVVSAFGEEWTTTLSHEILELLADPSAVLTVSGPSPKNSHHFVNFDLEVCDPTQGDSYDIDGITVSNFVTRAYFGIAGGAARTNFLNLPLKPFGVRPKGYFQYEDGNQVHQVQGEAITPEMQERRQVARRRLGKARRNNLRMLRLETKS